MTSDRTDWLEWRRGGLGASDIAGVLGLSPWSSPWSVWADKVGLLPDDDNEVMEFGRWAERMVAPWFAEKTGLRVFCPGEQERVEDPSASWRRCTLDGRVLDTDGILDLTDMTPPRLHDMTLALLEMKTAGPGKSWSTIPPHYQAQAQWQMLTTGAEKVWFAVLMGRRLDVDHVLDRDQADIDLMVERAETFWFDHVVAGVPPEVDGSDATERALAAVYPNSIPDAVEVDGIAGVIDEWVEAKKAEKAAKERTKALANEIRASLRDHEEGTVGGERVVSWREQHRGSYVVEEADFRVLRHHKKKGSA